MPTDSVGEWAAPLAHVRDEELRNALAQLFLRAAEVAAKPSFDGRPAVVVLVSRRLSCVYDMLVANGLDVLDGCEVVTDRALDGGVSDLEGRVVIVLDDSIVLGTTLVDIYDDIVSRTRNADLVTTLVAAVDGERHSPALAEHLGLSLSSSTGTIVRSTKELEAFAFDVASCLYRAGVPYFTDFPSCAPVTTTSSALLELLGSSGWHAADVSAPRLFAGDSRHAWTLVPKRATSERVRSRGAAAATSIADVLKVRVYATVEGSYAKDLRIVPIGIPGAVAEQRLNEILSELRKETGFNVGCESWHARAKHRLLQMYLSSCVLAEVWPELVPLGFAAELSHDVLDIAPLATYFGRADAGVVMAAFDAAVEAYNARDDASPVERSAPLRLASGLGARADVRQRMILSRLTIDATEELAAAQRLSLLESAVEPSQPDAGSTAKVDPFWVLHFLLVFGFVDDELERKQEEILRTYDYPQYVEYRENHGDDVAGPRILKQGITMHELASMILPDIDMSNAWSASLASLAVDLGNDLGIVVPTTLESPYGVTSRQYRSGETAYLAAVPPEELVGLHREELHAGNLFCWAVLDDLAAERPNVFEEFHNDLNAIVAHALRGHLAQAWQGTVTERLETGFRAVVESRLVRGETDVAELSDTLIDESERSRIRKGVRFDWMVWRDLDAVGKPELIARVRLAPTTSSFD
jgi:hypothetical protein